MLPIHRLISNFRMHILAFYECRYAQSIEVIYTSQNELFNSNWQKRKRKLVPYAPNVSPQIALAGIIQLLQFKHTLSLLSWRRTIYWNSISSYKLFMSVNKLYKTGHIEITRIIVRSERKWIREMRLQKGSA